MTKRKKLSDLFQHIEYTQVGGADIANIAVADIRIDSRLVQTGDLFVALRGEATDGHRFLQDVLDSGCSAVLLDDARFLDGLKAGGQQPLILVEDSRMAYGQVAASFYNFPGDALRFIGITGTNGKTTITYLLERVLEEQGKNVGVIGTVNYRYGSDGGRKRILPAPFTTPDPLILQKLLREMVDEGVEIVLMEVSSHALTQRRLGDISFEIAAFTNLSHDHLDYHSTMEEYFLAKSLLFLNHLQPDGKGVITYPAIDEGGSRWADKMTALLRENTIEMVLCGANKRAAITSTECDVRVDATEVELATPAGSLSIHSPLVGAFNVDNMISTLAITHAMGLDLVQAADTLGQCPGAPGRLQRVELEEKNDTHPKVFVDYAHTPDALLNILKTLKVLQQERLICVFGCGGDRDCQKRPEMGKIAADHADVLIVTEDNPRSEPSEIIIEDILKGVCEKGVEQHHLEWLHTASEEKGCVVIPDRETAISMAVRCAGPEDIVVVAGKGHENYQLKNGGRRFFDDTLEVKKALTAWNPTSLSAVLGAPSPLVFEKRFVGEIATDTRNIQPGDVFIALKGENFDGHDFIDKAVEKGAGAVVTTLARPEGVAEGVPVYRVADTLKSLGDLANYRRRLMAEICTPVVIGLTGSCGKTTVKEMVAAILENVWPDTPEAPTGRVLKTQGNFNNLIGLPLSLLPIQVHHRAVVLEMGMNQPGEIARLTRIASPDICCITNVHGAHLEGLGSIEGVARAKEEIFTESSSAALHVVNLDNALIASAAEKYQQKKITFSAKEGNAEADLWAMEPREEKDGCLSFILNIGEEQQRVTLKVPGRHNIENCLAAAAMAHGAGIDFESIVGGLESFVAPDKRLQIVKTPVGYQIINDTYNANPASMAAGLSTLAHMKGSQKIAVLGDMLELGEYSVSAHEELGRRAGKSALAFLLLVGSFAEHTASGAISAGMPHGKVYVFDDKNELLEWLKNLEKNRGLPQDSWLLVKASRGMGLETIVEGLTLS